MTEFEHADDRHPPSAVLLLGNYRPAVAIARALGRRGHRVVLGLEGEAHGCRYSRHVDDVWDHPELASGPSAFSRALDRYLTDCPEIKFVVPVTEDFANYFASSGEVVARHAILVSPSAGLVEIFSDKIRALDLARSLGVAALPFKVVHDQAGLLEQCEQIGFPLTIRPIGTSARLGHKKALILEDLSELQAALPVWPDGHNALLLQKFAEGRRHNVYFAAHEGRIIAACESRIFRTNHPDGTGLAVDGVTVDVSPELFGDTEKLVAATDYTGIGLTQFIFDPDTGDRCFLELNPRVSGSHAVPENAGVPLSTLAVDLAVNDGPFGECIYGKSGLRYVWTSGDVCGVRTALFNRDIGPSGLVSWLWRIVENAARADFHMIWRLDDPLPAIVSMLGVVPSMTRLQVWWRKLINFDRVVSRES